MPECFDCKRPYGDNGFPDLIIPYWAWRQISPSGDDGGLLCPSCICKRLSSAGIRCEGAFMSGPIISVSEHAMWLHRRLENIELAIEGRDNHWSRIRELIDYAKTDNPNANQIVTEAQAIADSSDAHLLTCGRWFQYDENHKRYIPDAVCTCRGLSA
jgi:hypothetical protein